MRPQINLGWILPLRGAAAPYGAIIGTMKSAYGADSAHEIRVGDTWDLCETVAKGSVDTIVTSPPYWGLRTYGHSHDPHVHRTWKLEGGAPTEYPPYEWYRANGGVLGLEPYPEWFVEHLADIFDRLGALLRDEGNLWVNLGDTYFARWSSIRDGGRQGLGSSERQRRVTPSGGIRHDKQLLMIPARFAIAMQERGWILRNDLIWNKVTVAPRPERDRLRSSHEHFFHFVKRHRNRRPTYYYDLEAAEAGGLDVVAVPTTPGTRDHSAAFPLGLVRPRIRSSSPNGGLVLDPFCGTGTTLEAARLEGRRSIGFELSHYHAKNAAERLQIPLSVPHTENEETTRDAVHPQPTV